MNVWKISTLAFGAALVMVVGTGATPSAQAATAVYSGVFLGMAIAFTFTWMYARRSGHLSGLTTAQLAHLTRRNAHSDDAGPRPPGRR